MLYDKNQLKEALEEANDWVALRRGHCADIMIDTSDGQIWNRLLLDENTSITNGSRTVMRVYAICPECYGDLEAMCAVLDKVPQGATIDEIESSRRT